MTQSHYLRISIPPLRRLVLVLIAACSAILFLSSLLAAQTRDENAVLCNNSYPEVRINACTVLILSGDETPENLAADYCHRGLAY
jgi:hypothetical protein